MGTVELNDDISAISPLRELKQTHHLWGPNSKVVYKTLETHGISHLGTDEKVPGLSQLLVR